MLRNALLNYWHSSSAKKKKNFVAADSTWSCFLEFVITCLFIFHVVSEERVDPGRPLASKAFLSQCQVHLVIELDLCALTKERVSGL